MYSYPSLLKGVKEKRASESNESYRGWAQGRDSEKPGGRQPGQKSRLKGGGGKVEVDAKVKCKCR